MARCSLQVMGYALLKIFNGPATSYCLTYLFGLQGASDVFFISLTLCHEAFTVFYPDIIGTPGLHLMNCYEVSIGDITPPIKPLPSVFLPIVWEINTWLWACGTKECQLPSLRLLGSISKPKPLPFFHVSPLPTDPQ